MALEAVEADEVDRLGRELLALFGREVVEFGEQLVESQYPNYLSDVFQIDPEAAALAMAIAVPISAPLIPMARIW